MADLSVHEMVSGYLIKSLTGEFIAARPKQHATFTCLEPQMFELICTWLNVKPSGVIGLDDSSFRFATLIGNYSRTFQLTLLRPNRIKAVMLQ